MNSKKLFLYTLSTVVLMSCTKADEGLSFEDFLSDLDIATLLASAPLLAAAFFDSIEVLGEKAGPLFEAIVEGNFDEVVAIAGELVVTVTAVVTAAVVNVVLASGVILPQLNSVLGPQLEKFDPLNITAIFETGEKELATLGPSNCPVEYTYSIENVNLTGFSDIEITKFEVVEPVYEDNEFSGSFDVEIGGDVTLKTIIDGYVKGQNCTDHNSTESFQAIHSAELELWALAFKLEATVVENNMTVSALKFISSNPDYASDSLDVTYDGESDVKTELEKKMESEIQDYQDKLESADFFNFIIDQFEFPFSFELPFEFPF